MEKVEEICAAVAWEWQKEQNLKFLAKLAVDEGEMGVASATTMKLILIVVISIVVLHMIAKKTGIKIPHKEGV